MSLGTDALKYKLACEQILETAELVGKQHDDDPANEKLFGNLTEGEPTFRTESRVVEIDSSKVVVLGDIIDVQKDVILQIAHWLKRNTLWGGNVRNRVDAMQMSRMATVMSYFIMCNTQIHFGLDGDDRLSYYIGLHPDSPYCVKFTIHAA